VASGTGMLESRPLRDRSCANYGNATLQQRPALHKVTDAAVQNLDLGYHLLRTFARAWPLRRGCRAGAPPPSSSLKNAYPQSWGHVCAA
jgi:hypothetical protein